MSTLQLEKMGYNIGIRLVEDFLYRTQGERCKDFREVAEKVQLAFKLFLNVSPTVTGWSRWANSISSASEATSSLPSFFCTHQHLGRVLAGLRHEPRGRVRGAAGQLLQPAVRQHTGGRGEGRPRDGAH